MTDAFSETDDTNETSDTNETNDTIRATFADVSFVASSRLADYYHVGASKPVTVTARHASGRYVCHTCRTNRCEHTKRVEAYERVHGTPDERVSL